MSYVLDDVTRVFTGDALLIRLCGRTDFQEGSSARLYHSIHDRLFRLPESTLVCPGHDYYGNQESSIAEERTYNTRYVAPVVGRIACCLCVSDTLLCD
jgi:glyoxylase-like metal-dependent hydrolase (beta-lactamase superfamily II)